MAGALLNAKAKLLHHWLYLSRNQVGGDVSGWAGGWVVHNADRNEDIVSENSSSVSAGESPTHIGAFFLQLL